MIPANLRSEARHGDDQLLLGHVVFFSHPAIDGKGHASAIYGHLDRSFRSIGVKRNIAASGRGSNNITIAGE